MLPITSDGDSKGTSNGASNNESNAEDNYESKKSGKTRHIDLSIVNSNILIWLMGKLRQ